MRMERLKTKTYDENSYITSYIEELWHENNNNNKEQIHRI